MIGLSFTSTEFGNREDSGKTLRRFQFFCSSCMPLIPSCALVFAETKQNYHVFDHQQR